ncbi:MAG: hypothetical protein COA42_12855 [Alteromonadaceae bacterium]|nr:MAG: hypothetical protein COA42_12855 [Alteromonadaceae bacterium]
MPDNISNKLPTLGETDNWFALWPDGLIALDASGKIVALSHTAEQWLHLDCEQWQDADPHHLLCTPSREYHHTPDECPLRYSEQEVKVRSTSWKCANGHYLAVDYRVLPCINGKVCSIISFTQNQEDLHNQYEMEKFSQYVEKSPAPIAEFDLNGQLLFGNSALQGLLLDYGFDEYGLALAIPNNIQDACGRLALDWETCEDQHNQNDEYGDSVENCIGEESGGQNIIEVKVGDRVLSWYFHPMELDDETTIMGYAFDITAQKAAETLAEKQKSRARKDFYAHMVHEFRNPLNSILGFSELMIKRQADSFEPQALKRLKLIHSSGKQLCDLVTNTLDASKIESGKMSLQISEFCLKSLGEDISEQMRVLCEPKQLELQYISVTEGRICSDKSKIRQIITNLISNAIKYTNQGGVTLILSSTADPELGECYSFLISDTGTGIPEDKIATLFDSYQQADEHLNRDIIGTGLGLSVVKSFTELLGGKINVTSTYEQGSEFELLLPYASDLSGLGDDS